MFNTFKLEFRHSIKKLKTHLYQIVCALGIFSQIYNYNVMPENFEVFFIISTGSGPT